MRVGEQGRCVGGAVGDEIGRAARPGDGRIGQDIGARRQVVGVEEGVIVAVGARRRRIAGGQSRIDRHRRRASRAGGERVHAEVGVGEAGNRMYPIGEEAREIGIYAGDAPRRAAGEGRRRPEGERRAALQLRRRVADARAGARGLTARLRVPIAIGQIDGRTAAQRANQAAKPGGAGDAAGGVGVGHARGNVQLTGKADEAADVGPARPARRCAHRESRGDRAGVDADKPADIRRRRPGSRHRADGVAVVDRAVVLSDEPADGEIASDDAVGERGIDRALVEADAAARILRAENKAIEIGPGDGAVVPVIDAVEDEIVDVISVVLPHHAAGVGVADHIARGPAVDIAAIEPNEPADGAVAGDIARGEAGDDAALSDPRVRADEAAYIVVAAGLRSRDSG